MTGKCNAMRELMNLSDIMNFADTRNDVIFPWPFSITSMRSSNGGPELLADTRDSDDTKSSNAHAT